MTIDSIRDIMPEPYTMIKAMAHRVYSLIYFSFVEYNETQS